MNTDGVRKEHFSGVRVVERLHALHSIVVGPSYDHLLALDKKDAKDMALNLRERVVDDVFAMPRFKTQYVADRGRRWTSGLQLLHLASGVSRPTACWRIALAGETLIKGQRRCRGTSELPELAPASFSSASPGGNQLVCDLDT